MAGPRVWPFPVWRGGNGSAANTTEAPSNTSTCCAALTLDYEYVLLVAKADQAKSAFMKAATWPNFQQAKKPNALTQIIVFRDTIASATADDDVKSYDMVWLLHLVGDVHQPLHATARFSHDSPEGDRGGNDVLLCGDPCKKNLHSFWDQAAGTGTGITAIARAADNLDEAELNEVEISDPRSGSTRVSRSRRHLCTRRQSGRAMDPSQSPARTKKGRAL